MPVFLQKYYIDILKNHYFDFNGRASRKSYWMFVVINLILGAIFSGIDQIYGYPILGSIYSLAILLPGLGISVRRLHDIDRSWHSILFFLIPIVGGFILLYFMIKEGTQGDNQYGPEPAEDSPELFE